MRCDLELGDCFDHPEQSGIILRNALQLAVHLMRQVA